MYLKLAGTLKTAAKLSYLGETKTVSVWTTGSILGTDKDETRMDYDTDTQNKCTAN